MKERGGDVTLINARVATCEVGHDNEYGLLPGMWAITIVDGRIERLEPMATFPRSAGESFRNRGGKLVSPALIDCHTHLVFGGDRMAEWEMRLAGRSYAEIAQAGGGILSTVVATRACGEDQLFRQASERLRGLLSEGVACVEIKSGYGLTVKDELRVLRVIQRLPQRRPGIRLQSMLRRWSNFIAAVCRCSITVRILSRSLSTKGRARRLHFRDFYQPTFGHCSAGE